LDQHHQTTFERALSVRLEDFHRLFGKLLFIILVFFLDRIQFWLEIGHALLHVIASQRLLDHQKSDSERKQDDSYPEISSENSQKYDQQIEYRTI
jgi:hypothetical protein